MPRLPLHQLAAMALLAVPAACGGGEEAAPSAPPPPAATTAPPPAPEPPPQPASGAAPWPAPPDPMALTRAAGLVPERVETLDFHVHAHLDVLVDGEPVLVPAGIGIRIDDPGVQVFDTPLGPAYGGIEMCAEPCISPLHTHDATGVVHTESPTPEPNRLGQLFVEWDVRLDDACVGGYCEPEWPVEIYVDGEPYRGNPDEIELVDRRQIAIVVGEPPAQIPGVFDFESA